MCGTRVKITQVILRQEKINQFSVFDFMQKKLPSFFNNNKKRRIIKKLLIIIGCQSLEGLDQVLTERRIKMCFSLTDLSSQLS